jgi:hypothetical protein
MRLFDGPKHDQELSDTRERDGVPPSEQARRAILMWLEAKGVLKAVRKRSATRKRT